MSRISFSFLVISPTFTGACLEVASPLGIPDDCIFVVESDRIQRPCHVAWQNEKRIGVAFK